MKVLDFGLAKAMEPAARDRRRCVSRFADDHHARDDAGGHDPRHRGVHESRSRRAGKPVDKRADIWAFGVRAVRDAHGPAAVRGRDGLGHARGSPDARARTGARCRATPLTSRLLRRCLEKDPKTRLRDIGDAMSLLDETLAAPESVPSRSRLAVSLGALAAAGAVVAVALSTLDFRDQPPAAYPVRFEIPPPGKGVSRQRPQCLTRRQADRLLGDRRDLGSRAGLYPARLLAGTEGATNALVWSPDSRFLLFFTQLQVRDRRLRRPFPNALQFLSLCQGRRVEP